MKAVRLAYLATHPIQYHAPLLRRIAQEPGIDLHALFMSDFSVRTFYDEGFGREIKWDIPLTDGYSHEYLARKPGTGDRTPNEIRNVGLAGAIDSRKYDVLWSHGYAHRTNFAALIHAKRVGMKTLIRSDNQPRGQASEPGVRRKVRNMAARFIFRFGDAFLTAGALNRQYYRDRGVRDERLFTMPYAIDNREFRARALAQAPHRQTYRASLDLSPGRPVILFASKFQSRKRVLDLVPAFEKVAARLSVRPYLVIAGDGEDRPALEQAIGRASLEDDVRLLGFKNQTELPALFDLCDVFVLPAAREPWALVVNEVMCAGRAVVVSDEVGCAPDLVHPGENGYVHKVGDVEGLAACLTSVLESPDRCRAMGEKSWEIIQDWDFEADVVALKQALDYVLKR